VSVIPFPTPLQAMTTPKLESELLGLAGHIAAAEARFLQLLGEFDQRGGWAGDGIRSCAHWLSWRAGMSRRTAVERLRVAHALRNLPRISAAFGAGRVSYSKVRAITRITGSGPVDRQRRKPDRDAHPGPAADRPHHLDPGLVRRATRPVPDPGRPAAAPGEDGRLSAFRGTHRTVLVNTLRGGNGRQDSRVAARMFPRGMVLTRYVTRR
jgi:hypothetical protein